jgi:hypothetical protein
MPLLHFRITSNNQTINIDKSLHAQNFTFKRACVIKNDNTTTDYGGGCAVKIDFLQSGTEIVSNLPADKLYIPFANASSVSDIRFDLNFSTEDIRRSFQTNVFFYNNLNQPVFDPLGVVGEISYIDLYFEFQSIYDYNAY